MRKMKCTCEVCGKEKIITEDELFLDGWNYPPLMGSYKVISPRTCPDCSITKTVWWDIVQNKKTYEQLTEKQKKVIERIAGEPDNIRVE